MPEITLPYEFELRWYQDPLWQAVVVQNVLRALTVWPRRNGKDLTAVNVMTAKAVQRRGLYLYIGPYHNQIRQIIWNGADGTGKKFLDYIPPSLVERKRESVMEVELINGSIIKLLGSDNIDSIVGTNPIGLIYTEMSLQKEDAWSYMRPILAENGGWAIFNGTPRGLNHFWKMAKIAEKSTKWFYQYLTRDDTGVPSLEAIQADREGGMPESLIKQEYYCSWTASGEDVFIPLDIIQPAADNTLQLRDYNFEPRIMGVDVAYAAKGDKATIARRQGRMLHELESYQGMNNMAFASRVSQRIKEFKPNAVFVDAGRGEGVISRLEQLGHSDLVIPVHFGGAVFSELYSNKKAEMWGRTRDWFLSKLTPDIPDSEQLKKELSTPFFGLDEKNKLVMESKKAMKTRGEKSGDEADALILTFAEEIEAEDFPTERQTALGVTPEMLRMTGDRDNQPYNPLSYMDDLIGETEEYSPIDMKDYL